jgi:hypothetical protein
MATNAVDVAGLAPATGAFARIADRWIYVFMAGLFVLTALAGFVPDSIQLLTEVRAGQRPPLPAVVHIHAALMGTWLLLLLAQTTLVATDRRALHRKLGIVATILVPAILAAMVGITMTSWQQTTAMIAALSAHAPAPTAVIANLKLIPTTLLPEQFRSIVLFPTFTLWALSVRRKDPQTHKRLMILATLVPLPAAIGRMSWLPTTFPQGLDFLYVYSLIWLLPALAYDLLRRGRVHRAYVQGVALNLPFIIAGHFLTGTPWWLRAAPRLMGVKW